MKKIQGDRLSSRCRYLRCLHVYYSHAQKRALA